MSQDFVCPKCNRVGHHAEALVDAPNRMLMTGSSTCDAFACRGCQHVLSMARLMAGEYKKKGWF